MKKANKREWNQWKATGLAILLVTVSIALNVAGQKATAPGLLLQEAIHQEDVLGEADEAIALYRRVMEAPVIDHTLSAQAELRMARLLAKVGRFAESESHFQNIVSNYAGESLVSSVVEAAHKELERLTEAQPKPGISLRQVGSASTNLPGRGYMSSISADGRYVSYSDSETGNVGLLDLASGDARLVTQYGKWDETKGFTDETVISPDGKWIAFNHYMRGAKDTQLRVIRFDGSETRTIYRCSDDEWVIPHAWSPDGKQILGLIWRQAKSDIQGKYDIALFGVENASVRILKELEATRRYWGAARGGGSMVFSPDGLYIAYDFPPGKDMWKGDLYILSLRDGTTFSIPSAPGYDYVLGWSPDGKNLLFCSDRSGNLGIWRVPVAKGQAIGESVLARGNIGHIFSVGFTADGSFFHLTRNGTSQAHTASFNRETGVVGKPVRMTERISTNPIWRTDGSQVAYHSWRGNAVLEPPQLTVKSLNSDRVRDIASRINISWRPSARWHSDGQSIIVVGSLGDRGANGLYRIELETGEAIPMAENLDSRDISWSRDGGRLFLALKQRSIVFRDLEQGTEKSLFSSESWVRNLSASDTGDWVAFFKSKGKRGDYEYQSVDILSPETGEHRELFKIPAEHGNGLSFAPGAIAWTPDEKGLLFIRAFSRPEPDGTNEVWFVPIEGGQARKTGLSTDGRLSDVSFHPNANQIGFTVSHNEMELWAMESFLPE